MGSQAPAPRPKTEAANSATRKAIKANTVIAGDMNNPKVAQITAADAAAAMRAGAGTIFAPEALSRLPTAAA